MKLTMFYTVEMIASSLSKYIGGMEKVMEWIL